MFFSLLIGETYFIPWPRDAQFMQTHGCFDLSFSLWDKGKSQCPWRNHPFSNSVRQQNMKSTRSTALCLPGSDDAPHWEMCDFCICMGSCYSDVCWYYKYHKMVIELHGNYRSMMWAFHEYRQLTSRKLPPLRVNGSGFFLEWSDHRRDAPAYHVHNMFCPSTGCEQQPGTCLRALWLKSATLNKQIQQRRNRNTSQIDEIAP